jgi:hypothetical protein
MITRPLSKFILPVEVARDDGTGHWMLHAGERWGATRRPPSSAIYSGESVNLLAALESPMAHARPQPTRHHLSVPLHPLELFGNERQSW